MTIGETVLFGGICAVVGLVVGFILGLLTSEPIEYEWGP